MKLKYYFMMLAAAIASVSLTGCGSDVDEPVPPPPSGTGFKVTATDITQLQFTVNVVPEDKTQTYFFSYLSTIAYEEYCGSTPEGLAQFMYETFKQQAEFDQRPIDEIVYKMCVSGDQSEIYPSDDIMPGQKYIAFALAIDDTTGKAIGDPVIKQFKTLEAEGNYPKVNIANFRAGNPDGGNTDNTLSATCKIDIGYKVYCIAVTTEYMNELLAEGITHSSLVTNAGSRLGDTYIGEMKTPTGSTIIYTGGNIKSGTDYTFIIKVVSEGGRITVEYATAKTTGTPPAPTALETGAELLTLSSTDRFMTE